MDIKSTYVFRDYLHMNWMKSHLSMKPAHKLGDTKPPVTLYQKDSDIIFWTPCV